MKANFNHRRTLVLLGWGFMDALHIGWYSSHALLQGHIPYLTDIQATWLAADRFGSSVAGFALAFWTLEASLLMSTLLLFKGSRYAKYLGYAQVPLRLLLFTPSISLLAIAAGYLPVHAALYPLLVVASEVIKSWSLHKYT